METAIPRANFDEIEEEKTPIFEEEKKSTMMEEKPKMKLRGREGKSKLKAKEEEEKMQETKKQIASEPFSIKKSGSVLLFII